MRYESNFEQRKKSARLGNVGLLIPMLRTIDQLAGAINTLNLRAVDEYTPIVEGILRRGVSDARHIEHTLDGLLDFCGSEPVFALYKKLCRHYWAMDQEAAASYVYAYRDRWDSPEQQ